MQTLLLKHFKMDRDYLIHFYLTTKTIENWNLNIRFIRKWSMQPSNSQTVSVTSMQRNVYFYHWEMSKQKLKHWIRFFIEFIKIKFNKRDKKNIDKKSEEKWRWRWEKVGRSVGEKEKIVFPFNLNQKLWNLMIF